MFQPRLALVLLLGAFAGALVAVSTANEPGQLPGMWDCGCDSLGAPPAQHPNDDTLQRNQATATTYDWSDLAADPRCQTGVEWSRIANQSEAALPGTIEAASPEMSASGGCDTHIGSPFGSQIVSQITSAAKTAHTFLEEIWDVAVRGDLAINPNEGIGRTTAADGGDREHGSQVCDDAKLFSVPSLAGDYSPCFVPNLNISKDLRTDIDLAGVGRSLLAIARRAVDHAGTTIRIGQENIVSLAHINVEMAESVLERLRSAWQSSRPIIEEARRFPSPQSIDAVDL